MIVGQEQLYFIRYLDTSQLHGGNASDTVPRLYQLNTALREAKKINLRTADSEYLQQAYGFVEVIPAFITIGDPVTGPHVIKQP
jgi:hypothetical protein